MHPEKPNFNDWNALPNPVSTQMIVDDVEDQVFCGKIFGSFETLDRIGKILIERGYWKKGDVSKLYKDLRTEIELLQGKAAQEQQSDAGITTIILGYE